MFLLLTIINAVNISNVEFLKSQIHKDLGQNIRRDFRVVLQGIKKIPDNFVVSNLNTYGNRFSFDLGKQKLYGNIEYLIEVPVLKRNLERDEAIKDEDIEFITMDENNLSQSTILKPEQMIGKVANIRVFSHKPVRFHEIKKAILVKKGSRVRVTYRKNLLEINTFANAQSDGSLSQSIKLQNPSSQKEFLATVTGANEAEICG